MDDGAAQAGALSGRERRHLEALRLFVGGRGNDAIPVMKEILAEHPRDVLLMQRLYFLYFWQGRSADMLAITTEVLPALEDDGYALGYHAFALEENRRFDEALALAERAVARNPRDAWAVHAIAHVHYERGDNRARHREPAAADPSVRSPRLLPESPPVAPGPAPPGRGRLRARRGPLRERVRPNPDHDRLRPARFGGAGLAARPVRPSRSAIAGPTSRSPRGAGSRCRSCCSTICTWGWRSPPPGTWGAAEEHLERLRVRGKKSRNATLPEVVVPLLEGLHAFARGDHADCVAR